MGGELLGIKFKRSHIIYSLGSVAGVRVSGTTLCAIGNSNLGNIRKRAKGKP